MVQVFHLLVDEVLQRLALQHAPVGQGPVRHHVLFHLQRQILQFEAAHARSVERPHHRARAGADHDVRHDALCFQRLDHADVGEAARRTAAQHQRDLERRLGHRDGGRGRAASVPGAGAAQAESRTAIRRMVRRRMKNRSRVGWRTMDWRSNRQVHSGMRKNKECRLRRPGLIGIIHRTPPCHSGLRRNDGPMAYLVSAMNSCGSRSGSRSMWSMTVYWRPKMSPTYSSALGSRLMQ